MLKLFTPVKILVLVLTLASPAALAGRDSGGNGDLEYTYGNDDIGIDREVGARERCEQNAFSPDDARRCAYQGEADEYVSQ